MSKSVRAAVVVMVTGVLSLAACSGGDDDRVVPQGWQDEQVGALHLAVPPGWERAESGGEYWTDAWQVVEGDTVVTSIAVEYDILSNGPEAGLVVAHLLETMPAMAGYEVVERTPDPIDLDADFARARYVYETTDGATAQGVLWALGAGREQPAAIQLTGEVDDETIEQIEASLSFDAQK